MEYSRTAAYAVTEYRALTRDGKKYIEGYFAVFGSYYDICPGGKESIDPHAFDEAIVRDDVRALINHDSTLVLGRNTSKTLELRIDQHGLYGIVEINDADQDAVNAWARVERGDVSGCSFGFDILNEEVENMPDGTVHWIIKSVKLYEVSVCTFPAYTDTAVTARKADIETMRAKSLDAWKINMMKKVKTNA